MIHILTTPTMLTECRVTKGAIVFGVLLFPLLMSTPCMAQAALQGPRSDITSSGASSYSAGALRTGTNLLPSTSGRHFPANGDLLIGQGDLLSVTVFDIPEYSLATRVDASGNIVLPLVKAIRVEDLTPAQAADKIRATLLDIKLVNDPQVSVNIVEYVSHAIAVTGEVKTPGLLPAIGIHSLSDVLTVAQGRLPTATDRVTVTHKDGRSEIVDLLKDPHAADSIQVVPGDIVSVERAPIFYVLGSVVRPGGYPLTVPTTVLQAIALAMGTQQLASLKQLVLIRTINDQRVIIPIPYKDVLKGKSSDVAMQGNDILYVPLSGTKQTLQYLEQAAVGAAPSALIYTH